MYGSQERMIVYASTEVHNCANKAVELLGLGSESLRLINVDDNYEIKIDELQQQIKADAEEGLKPFCVIGNAVTVNTGACDNLNALADIC